MNERQKSLSIPRNPHYRNATSVGVVVSVIFLGGLILAIFSGGWFDGSQFLGVMACLIALIISAGVFFELANARRVDRYLNALEKRDFLAHWKYTPEEWRPFAESETQRGRKEVLVLMGTLAVGTIGGTAYIFITNARGIRSEKPLVMAGIFLATAAIVAAIGLIVFFQKRRRWNRTQAQIADPPDSYIGRGYAVSAGGFILWGIFNQSLAHVRFVPGDVPMIEFGLKVGREIIAKRVLIPRRYAALGAQLAAAISAAQKVTPDEPPAQS